MAKTPTQWKKCCTDGAIHDRYKETSFVVIRRDKRADKFVGDGDLLLDDDSFPLPKANVNDSRATTSDEASTPEQRSPSLLPERRIRHRMKSRRNAGAGDVACESGKGNDSPDEVFRI